MTKPFTHEQCLILETLAKRYEVPVTLELYGSVYVGDEPAPRGVVVGVDGDSKVIVVYDQWNREVLPLEELLSCYSVTAAEKLLVDVCKEIWDSPNFGSSNAQVRRRSEEWHTGDTPDDEHHRITIVQIGTMNIFESGIAPTRRGAIVAMAEKLMEVKK